MSREATPDLVMLATESAKETIDTLCRVRNSGYNGPIVVIVSRHTVLTLEDLRKFDVGAIISFSHTVPDLENLIHATLAGYSEPLAQQYSRLCKTLNIPEMGIILNAREREILDLVSNDLADREIAERLNVSVRTINNHLRHIYAKLHVRTRLGAVLAAVSRGLICAVRE
ncbi:MAG TPA: LuxR C-terminal-related transcriptional regulator [Chloroflexia bacterium]